MLVPRVSQKRERTSRALKDSRWHPFPYNPHNYTRNPIRASSYTCLNSMYNLLFPFTIFSIRSYFMDEFQITLAFLIQGSLTFDTLLFIHFRKVQHCFPCNNALQNQERNWNWNIAVKDIVHCFCPFRSSRRSIKIMISFVNGSKSCFTSFYIFPNKSRLFRQKSAILIYFLLEQKKVWSIIRKGDLWSRTWFHCAPKPA